MLRKLARWLHKLGLVPAAFGRKPSVALLLSFWLLGVSGGTHVADLTVEASDDLDSWADNAELGYGLAPTDDIDNLADFAPTVRGAWSLVVSNQNLDSWADAQSQSLDAGATDLPETLSDDLDAWADSHREVLGYEEPASDDLDSWSDLLNLGYGLAFSEDIDNLADAHSLVHGYNIARADNLDAWADALELLYEYRLSPSDDIDNLADSYAQNLSSGEPTDLPLSLSDDADNLADFDPTVVGGWQLTVSNQDLDSWSDTYSQTVDDAVSLFATASDDLDNWADPTFSIELEWELQISESAFNLSDAHQLTYDYVWVASESINSWSDQFAGELEVPITAGLSVEVSDNLNNWNDGLVVFTGVELEQALSDNVGANWNDAVGVTVGYQIPASDTLNNWSDAHQKCYEYLVALSDDADNWADAIGLGYGYHLPVSDGAGFIADGFEGDIGVPLQAEISLSISENLNNWAELFEIAQPIELALSDNAANLADALSFILVGVQEVTTSDSIDNWQDDIGIVRFQFTPLTGKRAFYTFLRRF